MRIEDYLSKDLQSGETVVTIIRRSGWTMVLGTLGGGLLLLANFFLVAWWFRWQMWGAMGFILMGLVAAVWIVRTIYLWRTNLLVVTSKRIVDIDQRGFFQRAVTEAPYEKIQDVRYTIRGVWQTLFKYGSVVIQTAGSETNLELSGIADPVSVQRLISDIRHQTEQQANRGLSAPELVEVLDHLKAEIGEAKFQAILQRRKPTL